MTGVLKARVGGNWVDISGGAAGPPGVGVLPGGTLGQVLAKKSGADYDTEWVDQTGGGGPPIDTSNFVLKTGDTMSGLLRIHTNAEALALQQENAYIGWWGTNSRLGYAEGHAGGLTISADVGELYLGSASGRIQFPGSISVGNSPVHGGWSGMHYQSGNYMIMQNGSDTYVSANGGVVSIRGGANSGYYLNVQGDGNHYWSGHTHHQGYNVDGIGQLNVNAGVYCNGIMNYGASTVNGDMVINGVTTTTNHINTRNGYRVTSNGGWGGDWGSHSFLAQTGNGSRAGLSIHPGGVAKSIDIMVNNGYVNFLNEGGDWYADLYANSIVQVSQGRGKQDIVSWPSKSAGSAVMDACNRLSLIDVISYRIKPELALIQAETMLEGQGPRRTHDCAIDDCLGTDMETDPCQRVKDWSSPQIGVIIEDLATVLPEAVGLDPEGNPGGMRLGSMIGYLLAVCKEQQERLEALEHHLEAA